MRHPVTGGLSLPTNIGVGETEQSKIHSTWDTVDKVEGELAMEGFIPMMTPEFECPQVTEEELTTEDSKSYTQTFARQFAWFNYSSQVLARVTVRLLQIENEQAIIESRMRVGFKERMRNGAPKMSEKDIQDQINLDPRYQELMLQAQNYKQKKTVLSAFAEGIERGLKVISRQVEIRKGEIEAGKVNIPGRGYGMRGP